METVSLEEDVMAGLAVKVADRLNSACLQFPDLGPDISVSSAKGTIAKKIDLAPDQVIGFGLSVTVTPFTLGFVMNLTVDYYRSS